MPLKKEVLPPRETPTASDVIAAAKAIRDRRQVKVTFIVVVIVGALLSDLFHFLGAFG